MNGYERYHALLRGDAVDFLPRLPILMAFAAEYIGSNYGAFASDHRVLAEANLRCAEDFDFDQISAVSDPYRETQGFGALIEFIEDGVPRCVAPPLENDKDLTLLKQPDPLSSERMLDRVLGIRTMQECSAGRHTILGWIEGPAAEAADLRGIQNFMMDLVMEADYACALMDRCVEVGIDFAIAQLEAGADTIGIGDAIASQVSPSMYAEYIFPREQRMVEAIQAAGGLARLHICGDTTHLLPYFAELNCDVIDLDWQVDLGQARKVLGSDQVFLTNLDPVKEVLHATPETIQQRLQELYEIAGNRLMIGAGCEIPPGTPHENLKALCTPIPFH